VFDDLQAQLAANRSEFYRALPSGPFYGFNRPGAASSDAIIQNWWRRGMMGGAKAHYDGIIAFSQPISPRTGTVLFFRSLVMHGDDDQNRSLRRLCTAVRSPREERDAEDVQRIPARHADHPKPRRSTLTCWPSCSPDRYLGWVSAVALHSVHSNTTGLHPIEHPHMPRVACSALPTCMTNGLWNT
jgi:hypothetical protein